MTNPWGQLYQLSEPRPAIRMGSKGRVHGIYDNPWNLSPTEEKVLQALTEKRPTAVAAALDVGQRTVEEHSSSCRKKMGAETTLLAVIAYDRWKRPGRDGDAVIS